MDEFQIQTWPVTSREGRVAPTYLHNVLVDAEHNTFVLHDFQPMSLYKAHIVTVNQGYQSDPSSAVKFTMPEGGSFCAYFTQLLRLSPSARR